MSDIGPQRRKARLRLHITLTALARLMGISAPYLLDLERDHRHWSASLLERHDTALEIAASKNPTSGKD